MYSHVVLGGTFDHLHAGHEDLLRLAFESGRKVSLGLTKASMNTRKVLANQIQPYHLREKALREFAQKANRQNDLSIIPLHDIYGNTRTDRMLEAIVVTPHTRTGAQKINEGRKSIGLPELEIIVCPLHHDSHGDVLCSTNIRRGIVDRQGNRFDDLTLQTIALTPEAKEVLHRPFGSSIHAFELRRFRSAIILIGDIVTDFCIQHTIPFTTAYVDGYSKRKPFAIRVQAENTAISNPAGSISRAISEHISHNALDGKQKVYRITGEEDILTVAAVLLSPLGTKIVYGYPFAPEGMRCISVTERIKEVFKHLLY